MPMGTRASASALQCGRSGESYLTVVIERVFLVDDSDGIRGMCRVFRCCGCHRIDAALLMMLLLLLLLLLLLRGLLVGLTSRLSLTQPSRAACRVRRTTRSPLMSSRR
jgi:hypothetical protein